MIKLDLIVALNLCSLHLVDYVNGFKTEIVCCLFEADLDKQLDNIEAKEMAEEESSDVNSDGNDGNVNEDTEDENKENDEKMEEQQTEEVCTKFDSSSISVLF